MEKPLSFSVRKQTQKIIIIILLTIKCKCVLECCLSIWPSMPVERERRETYEEVIMQASITPMLHKLDLQSHFLNVKSVAPNV